jgi:hypothetical protein
MVVKNLEFFDKNGYNLNLNWNEEKHIWEGNIFFPRVSVGLYENTTIYVVEYIGQYVDSDSDYTDDVYSYPMGEGNIAFQWDLANAFVDEFFMFNFDEDYEIKDTSSLIHMPYDGPVCETLIVNRFEKYLVPLFDSAQNIEQDDLLEVHVAFMADENTAETTYKRTLVMYYENGYTKYEIARITFFAETIEEDERLKIWNENLGYNLKPEDTIIFKHSDIHEPMPDYEILNEKRKELMLEGHNIYPYIGGYKAVLNAIKFFGYDNLNIVEYWRNINEFDSEFGKIYRTYVYSLKDRKTLSTKRRPISLNTKNFQKLSNISLVYNINHPEENKETGKKYDEYGLPNVMEDFDKDKRDDFILTVEEALVKLFALRKKLNDEFMPGSTKITNIIGEGNYFGLNLIGNNPQISTVNYVESKGYVDFTVFPDKYCYLTENEDFARFITEEMDMHVDVTIGDIGNKTIAELAELYDGSDSDSDISISEIDKRSLGGIISNLLNEDDGNNTVCDFYEEYYSITYDNNFGDAKKYGLREIPEARNIYNDKVLDDVPNDPYGKNDVVPDMVVCAKAILKGNFSENINITSIIEWKITHPETGWSDMFYGDVKTFGNVFVQLPYLGNYDVEMNVWDVYNHCCRQVTKDAIIVKPYNIDIRGFYYDARPLPEGLKYDLIIPREYLDDLEKEYRYYLWAKDEGGVVTKGIVTRKRNPMEMVLSEDIIGEYLIDGYEVDDYKGLTNLRDAIDKERWISIVNTESDGNDILNFAWLYGDEDGTVLYGVDTYNYVEELVDVPFDENDAYVPEWNSDALYHVIKKNVDKMYSWALYEHLKKEYDNSTMRNYQPSGRVSFEGPYYKFDVDTILYRAKQGYKEYDHLNEDIINLKPGKHYENVRYINSVVDIKPLTWVLLGFDYTRITGRLINNEYPKWTLIMLGDKLDPDENFKGNKIVNEHNGLYFSYLFEEEGSYKIKLELMDINGNKYELEKFIVIVDKDANYGMYHSLKNEYDKYLQSKSERNLAYLT